MMFLEVFQNSGPSGCNVFWQKTVARFFSPELTTSIHHKTNHPA